MQSGIQKWKYFENPSTFAQVKLKSRMACFFSDSQWLLFWNGLVWQHMKVQFLSASRQFLLLNSVEALVESQCETDLCKNESHSNFLFTYRLLIGISSCDVWLWLLHIHLCRYPNRKQYADVLGLLIFKYPFLRDKSATGYVSLCYNLQCYHCKLSI